MSNKKPKKFSLIDLPVKIDYENTKTQERKILEFDPDKVKAGEAIIVKVPKWGGLSNQCFVVLNVEGKEIIVQQLKEEKSNTS